jgi:hypothetical protein
MSNLSLIEHSRRAYTSRDVTAQESEVQTGALQRIASAVETMSGNYQKLIEQRDTYYRWFEVERASRRRLERSNSALRGVVTKLKRRP